MWKDGNLPLIFPLTRRSHPLLVSVFIYIINNVLAGFIRIFVVGGGKQVDVGRPGPGGVRAVHWHRALEAKGPNPRYVHTISYSWYTQVQ